MPESRIKYRIDYKIYNDKFEKWIAFHSNIHEQMNVVVEEDVANGFWINEEYLFTRKEKEKKMFITQANILRIEKIKHDS